MTNSLAFATMWLSPTKGAIALAEPTSEALEDARAAYAERKQTRAERLAHRAAAARSEGERRLASAKATADAIPLGQPIITGRGSRTTADINRRRRMRENTTKGFDLLNQAENLDRQAAAVGSNGVDSDDPDAVAKLQAKVEAETRKNETRKAVNKIVRRFAKKLRSDNMTDLEGCVQALRDAGYSEKLIASVVTPDPMGYVGFPSYSISNTTANIRRIQKRIEELQAHDVLADIHYEGVGWSIDLEDGRLVVRFDVRQPDEIRARLRGWNWSRTRQAFVRKDTPNARREAELLASQFPGLVVTDA